MTASEPHAESAATPESGAFGACPYSEETVAGCRFYRAAAQHGAYPGAAECRSAIAMSGPVYLRRRVCLRRTLPGSVPVSLDGAPVTRRSRKP